MLIQTCRTRVKEKERETRGKRQKTGHISQELDWPGMVCVSHLIMIHIAFIQGPVAMAAAASIAQDVDASFFQKRGGGRKRRKREDGAMKERKTSEHEETEREEESDKCGKTPSIPISEQTALIV
ncbi:hypothetical protein NQZ68_001757 [Dissostichus eleginoides]|nr:hypothetical protein NQZ68_001757 [Dissostichus eleginoides]